MKVMSIKELIADLYRIADQGDGSRNLELKVAVLCPENNKQAHGFIELVIGETPKGQSVVIIAFAKKETQTCKCPDKT